MNQYFFKNNINVKKTYRNSGFSLIELLVVIGVLGIIAGGLIVLIDPIGQIQKSNDAKRKSDLKQIQTGLELYRSDVGAYPTNNSWLNGSLSQGGFIYMQTVPKDPKFPTYNYNYSSTGSTYLIRACAENKNSPDVKTGSISGCSTGYIFEVSSP